MAREFWTADGFVLTDGLVRDVEYRDGLYSVQTTRGSGVVVAGMHGELHGGRRFYGPGSFVLHMWAGAPYGGTRTDAEAAWETLVRVLAKPRLVNYNRGMASGAVRQCLGRLSGPLTLNHLGQLGFRFSAEVEVPGAFWTDLAVSSDITPNNATLPKDLLLTSKAAATAPMADLTYRVTGPVTDPVVSVTSDPELSDSFSYSGWVPTAQVLEVNADTWTVTLNGNPIDWTRFSYTGYRFLEVPAADPGVTPAVRLAGAGGGPATKLEVLGRASYLC